MWLIAGIPTLHYNQLRKGLQAKIGTTLTISFAQLETKQFDPDS